MKKTAVLLTIVAAAGLMAVMFSACSRAKPSQGKEIVWGDFKNGATFARKNNLPMMIHFTATWSPGCKRLEKEVYGAPDVIRLSQDFVCVKVDGDKEKELVERYGITGYPTIVFTNSKAETVHRIGEFVPPDVFLAQMKAALQKLGGAEAADKRDSKKTK